MNYLRLAAMVVFVSIITSTGRSAPTTAPEAGAEAMYQQIQAMKAPLLDEARRDDEKYIQSFLESGRQWEQKRNDAIKQFVAQYPQHPQARTLMNERWMRMAQSGQRKEVIDETTPLLAITTDPQRRADILFARAAATVMLGLSDESTPRVEEFITAAPRDDRGGELLLELAQTEHSDQKQADLYRRAAERYAATRYGKMAKGLLRQSESIGKPFDLAFTDAISGKEISVQKDLKGKVVVIDFWATWCGPCIAEMPAMRKLYSDYKDKGVEFIGISLDLPETRGGLTVLQDYVKKNQIAWPQYYQGNEWQSEFSAGWGINEIPTAFILDKQGQLVSVKARGQLEMMIPKLLAGESISSLTHMAGEPVH